MILDKNDKLVMTGDSITDCERGRPAGEGLFDPYGNGYVNMVKAFLDAKYPEQPIRLINKGNGGHTVRDLKDIWQESVLDQKPDWLSIMIGINDVWRQFDSPKMTEDHVGLEEYESCQYHCRYKIWIKKPTLCILHIVYLIWFSVAALQLSDVDALYHFIIVIYCMA